MRVHVPLQFILVGALILAGAPASADLPQVTKRDPRQEFVDEDTEVTLTSEWFDPETSVILGVGGPFLVGNSDTPGSAVGIAVAGYHAYVADSDNGM